MMRYAHPEPILFLEHLHEEFAYQDYKAIQLDSGLKNKQSKQWAEQEERTFNLVSEYRKDNIMRFLSSISFKVRVQS